MRVYPLHYINSAQFEDLATLICCQILGEATIPFAQGTDGGRDGRFTGKANCFPSEAGPWEGKIVIQAKHTSKENASCSDSEFATLLKNEVIPAIKRLKDNNKVEYYILFTNRKLTGKQDEKIEGLIYDKTEIPNIIIAVEKIQQYLRRYPNVVREAKLNDLLKPLQFDEEDLKAIVSAIHSNLPSHDILMRGQADLTYLDLTVKNQLNVLGQEFFDDVIKKSVTYFELIKAFLSDGINAKYKAQYEDTVAELNAKITLSRKDYVDFETMLEDLFDHVISNNPDLTGKKKLVRVFLHYMYCNCDIGKKA